MLTTAAIDSSERRTLPPELVAGFRILGDGSLIRFENWQLAEKPILIGRGPECDIQLADGTVSRKHCTLAVTIDGRCILQDQNSCNGVRISDARQDSGYRRVRWHMMQPGTFVQLGRVTLVMVNADGQCPLAAVKHRDWLRLGFNVYCSERNVLKHMDIKRRLLARIYPPHERPKKYQ